MSTDPSTAPAPRPRLARRAWGFIAGLVGVVGAVTGVISIWPILTANASGIDSLRLSAEPYPETATEWALPLGTDLSTYPASEDDGCTAPRRAWLEQHATPVHRTLLLDLRNVADSGPMLSVSDVRIEGDRSPHRDTAVLVVCDTSTVAPRPLEAAMLDASSTGSVAVFSAASYGIQQEGLPDLPVTWNLAPGETGLVVLRVGSTIAFDGTLTASVIDRGEAVDVPFTFDGGDTIASTALVELGMVHLRAGATLSCVDERDLAATCDAATLITPAG